MYYGTCMKHTIKLSILKKKSNNNVSNKSNNEIGFDDDEVHSFELDTDNSDSFELK